MNNEVSSCYRFSTIGNERQPACVETTDNVDWRHPLTDPTLAPTALIDCDHPAIVQFVGRIAPGAPDLERAVALYYAVRDGFRYDPYRIDLSPGGMRASTVLATGHGWCVPKAALLAAACRAARIPARVGYADVRNHLSTERMRMAMGTDIFYWHGFTEILLGGKWVKATPAFNLELCRKFRVKPLEFDGHHDSIFHPFDADERRHMEYVRDRGSYADVPVEEIKRVFREAYPGLYKLGKDAAKESFAPSA
jgi:transglutaminase-like putative cysteine protease